MFVPLLILAAGYTIGSYGWVLVKGYDIPLRQWVSPLNPWTWNGTPPPIPPGQLFPSSASSAGSAGAVFSSSTLTPAEQAAEILGASAPPVNPHIIPYG